MKVLKVENLVKNYFLGQTKIEALKGVDLSLEKGEFTALIGSSGSGKSTLLNLIGCLDRPDSGKIFLENKEVSQLNDLELDFIRNKKLGYIFQSFNLISVLNIFENVELPLLVSNKNILNKMSTSERKERVMLALDEVGLTNFSNHLPDKLSGGQRQRAAIARCLVTNPSFILADEPTANLDSVTAHHVIDLLLKLNQEKGVTFLFCTHDEKLMGRVSRVVKIQDGIII